MRVFAAVARAESFTEGARRLNISTRVASATVKQLEQRLETQFLNRTTRSVKLTGAGQAYLERAERLLSEFDELESTLLEQQSKLAGAIRVSAPTAFGAMHLAPALADFMQEHPDVQIDLDLSDRRVAIVEEGFDLVIRVGRLMDSALMYKRLMNMRFVLCASPDYLAAHGSPKHPQALSAHECLINSGLHDPYRWRFSDHQQDFEVRVNGRFHANAPLPVALLVERGLGIAQLPEYIIRESLASGRLVRLFAEYERVGLGVYALYPHNRHLTARTQALIRTLLTHWSEAPQDTTHSSPPSE